MSGAKHEQLPEFHPMGIAAVKLFQGAIYDEDQTGWSTLLDYRSELFDYFARVGMVLVIDESQGMAWLRQLSEEERTGGYEKLPKMFRRAALNYDTTLVAVLLRDAYRRFVDEALEEERCLITTEALAEIWPSFFSADEDPLKLQRRLTTALRKLEQMQFIRPVAGDGQEWEVRRILKARLPLEQLELLRDQLQSLAEQSMVVEDSNEA